MNDMSKKEVNMILNEVIGIQEIEDPKVRITVRRAVRAIIFRDGKILMVHTNRGDYKFPGGGVKKKESFEEALRREVTEETGYMVDAVGRRLGTIIQRNKNQFDTDGLFEMISYYYFCTVTEELMSQHLDKYEEDQEFEPVWVNLDEVIRQNEEILSSKVRPINNWVYRETLALKRIRECVASR